jgi:hypothetical protein
MNAVEAGYREIDTARAYSPHAPGTSEPILGKTDCKEWAVIDTKIPPYPGSGKGEKVAESVRLSLESLGVSKVCEMAGTLSAEGPQRLLAAFGGLSRSSERLGRGSSFGVLEGAEIHYRRQVHVWYYFQY